MILSLTQDNMCNSEVQNLNTRRLLRFTLDVFVMVAKLLTFLFKTLPANTLWSLQFVHAQIWFIDCCIYAVGTKGFHRDLTGSEKEARELMILGMIIMKRK